MKAEQVKKTEEEAEEEEAGTFEHEVAGPETSEQEETEQEMEELERKLEEAGRLDQERLDQLIRCRAELDNVLKRAAREKEELSRYAAEKLIVKLLPVLDSLDQATKHDEGLEKIRQQLLDVLRGEGLATMDVVGEKFDPYMHEALMMVQSDEHEEGTVMEEVLRGYTLRSKPIRFSKVLVAKK